MPPPGDPDAIEDARRGLAAAARAAQTVGESVAGHGRATTADWTGLAAPLALARTQQDASNVQRVAEAANDAAGPLARFAEELRAAQQDYARGEAMVAQGPTATSRLEMARAPGADAGWDRAQQAMDDGAALMRAAEERARVANETAARALDAAPTSLAGIAPAPATPPAAASTSPPAELGNIAASLGNAALEHPVDALAVAGGGLLAGVAAAGGLASLALDGTGVGLIAGVPLGGASAAGVTAGAGIAGAGLLDLASHAATDNSIGPFQVEQESDASHIEERARTVGKPGKNKRVRVVETEVEVRALYDELSEGGTPTEWPDYDGHAVRFPDGTGVGLRNASSSAPGSTVDVRIPGQAPRKVHREDP